MLLNTLVPMAFALAAEAKQLDPIDPPLKSDNNMIVDHVFNETHLFFLDDDLEFMWFLEDEPVDIGPPHRNGPAKNNKEQLPQ